LPSIKSTINLSESEDILKGLVRNKCFFIIP